MTLPCPFIPCPLTFVLWEGINRAASVPGPCEPEDLIDGIIFAANYLGSTQLLSERNPSKNIRMMQAQEAVSRVKVGRAHGHRDQLWQGERDARAGRARGAGLGAGDGRRGRSLLVGTAPAAPQLAVEGAQRSACQAGPQAPLPARASVASGSEGGEESRVPSSRAGETSDARAALG